MYIQQCLTPVLMMSICVYKAQACDKFTDLGIHNAIVGTNVHVRLLLYTRANETCGRLLPHANASALPLQFDLSRPTAFVVHGLRPTGSPPVWLQTIVSLLLAREDMNVVVVDWNKGATNVDYFKTARNTREVAANLTAFIRTMQERGASLSSIHMIGVSLGAHISGFVGADLKGNIGRITALDAAGPLFTGASPEDRLDPTDAQFVDVVHTDMDALGFRKPLGHIDFYPNGGADQIGCPKTILSGTAYFKCDHQRSVYLYLESLNSTCKIQAFPCSSYTDFLDGRCLDCKRFHAEGCPVFGYDVIKWKKTLLGLGQSKAFFTTNEKNPFCKTSYRLDIVTWNHDTHWGYITIKLYSNGQSAKATINHKASKFEKYTETRMLAQFDRDVPAEDRVSVTFSTGNVLKPKYKLRVLRLRLQRLGDSYRPLCRYDILLMENKAATFRLLPCEESNF